jgi:dTDP-4-dehydro-6-deoxy-alpha-D-glucopyranose 2,3-dehydratase
VTEVATASRAGPDGGEADAATMFTRSATAGDRGLSSTAAFHDWWAARPRESHFEVTRIPFAELDGWHFDLGTGNLGHESGRFFTIEGLRARGDGTATWSQPIINQPEIGILGLLAKEFNGVLHFLMQARMEPGNVNTLQLSPTVQATRSNYTRVHRGGGTPYLEYFAGPGRERVLVDGLQSEQGAWFWHKHNRNTIVQVTGDVPEHEDYRWLTLHQIRDLLKIGDLVNMDARTVLACMPLVRPHEPGPAVGDPFTRALLRSYMGDDDGAVALHTQGEILSWFTEMKTRCAWSARLVPLSEVTRWSRTDDEIVDDDRTRFSVVGVRVRAANREVTRWAQPLLAPRGPGLAAFVARPIKGVLHLLVRARVEPGLRDLVEMAPTVQLPPAAEEGLGTEPFLDDVARADPARVRFDTVLSEEGGRFYHARTRYQVVEVDEEFPIEVPEDFRWLTVHQLMELLRHGHYLTIEARSLLACVHSLW